jgi:DNA-binding XRE family transcriptional regulator/predicted RNase H-like HicB family nuclease
MQYPAIITKEGKATLAEFPGCPGCQTFAEEGQDIAHEAQEALEGWLEAHLMDGEAPSRPPASTPRGKSVLMVPVSPQLAVRLLVRWARQDANLTQAEVAKRAGVSQQAIAKLEQRASNPTLGTLSKVAEALSAQFDVVFKYSPSRQPVAKALRKRGGSRGRARA